MLYDNGVFHKAIFDALEDRGVFIAQVGQQNDIRDPARSHTSTAQLDRFIISLKTQGFIKTKEYSEAHCGFEDPWNFLVAFKDDKAFEQWFASEAHLDLQLQSRLLPNKSGASSLRYFDGATMTGYQYPSRIVDEVFCRNVPTPAVCEGVNNWSSGRVSESGPFTNLTNRHLNFGE